MARQIAIVEDEPAIRANYSDALRRLGFEVQTYASRPEASSGFDIRLPDLVLIDIGLGDEPEGGFELCRELRQKSATLPIIFLTARDSDFDATPYNRSIRPDPATAAALSAARFAPDPLAT